MSKTIEFTYSYLKIEGPKRIRLEGWKGIIINLLVEDLIDSSATQLINNAIHDEHGSEYQAYSIKAN